MQSGSSDLPPCEFRLKTVGERVSHRAAESLGERCTVPSCALLLSGLTPTSPLPHRPGRRSEGGGHASALSRGLLFAGLTARRPFLRRGGGGATTVCVFSRTLHGPFTAPPCIPPAVTPAMALGIVRSAAISITAGAYYSMRGLALSSNICLGPIPERSVGEHSAVEQ